MDQKAACITLNIEPDYLHPQKRVRLFEDSALMERYLGEVCQELETRAALPQKPVEEWSSQRGFPLAWFRIHGRQV